LNDQVSIQTVGHHTVQSVSEQRNNLILSETEVVALRCDFPALDQSINGFPLAYLDNAATTQKPRAVIDAIDHFYTRDNANVRRGAHTLSERATAAYEGARKRVARFINASAAEECIFVRGTTEAINLVARSYLQPRVQAGDEILVTHLEHHANIVPWQLVAEQSGAKLVAVPVLDSGEVDMTAFAERLNSRTRMVAVAHVSNALGSVNPVAQMIALAKAQGVPVAL
jgi:cysteine desulfurase/selenocysteine lyase